ncbi:MAG: HlyD family secretion protein [Candidatus Lindowbacteria bacterium]|nr:HlyD family secretion protein [Candidatus Lindowbacteria bacterium]
MADENEEKATNQQRLMNPKRVAVVILLLLAVVGVSVAYYFWHRSQIYVTTDDAHVNGHIHTISSRVSGTVAQVDAEDNQLVEQGQPLVKLDPATFEADVRDAEAALELARNEVAQMKAAVKAAAARLENAKAALKQTRIDLERAENLTKDGIAPREMLDKARTGYDAAAAGVRTANEELRRAQAALGDTIIGERRKAKGERDGAAYAAGEAGKRENGEKDKAEGVHPLILKRRAELEQVKLSLSYTEIYAPVKGNVTRKTVEVGNRIQPGQPLMMVVPLNDIWVVANYKETQLKRVKVGQPVEIEVDTYPGVKLNGRVESIMAGTGAVFSLFPPENATGNFVKVVQRIPVKIVLEETPNPHVLRVGMSVIPTIDTTK